LKSGRKITQQPDRAGPGVTSAGAGLLLLSVLLIVIAASVGSSGWSSLLVARHDPVTWQIVTDIRLPRALGAWLAGGLLGLAGAVAQGLFRNPLADPYLLGSASGASLGVTAALVWLGASAGAPGWWVPWRLTGAAFVGAVSAVLLTLLLARGVASPLRLLLAGVVVGVVLGALSQLLIVMNPEVLLATQTYLMGNTSLVSWNACQMMAAALVPCLLIAVALSPLLDALSLGEATAASLGMSLARGSAALVGVLAFATAVAVAQTGLIGFVGLAAPHAVRRLVAVTHRHALWLAGLMGAVLLLASDTLARSLLAPMELPVGVLTAVLGGAYLLWRMDYDRQLEGM